MDRSLEEVYLYRNQDFYNIRDWCLRHGYLFEDPYFQMDYRYEWTRPHEITSYPQLFVGGSSRFDVHQGRLGDCWMLAGISALAMQPTLVKRVVPLDQSFTDQYAGIFHFRIWRFGKWFDVVVDDLLPTLNGRLAFAKSNSQNEFWVALLEKAYCKVLGEAYRAADAGNLCEALEDLTGGVVEQFRLLRAAPNFQNILTRSVARHSLIGCFIEDLPGTSQNKTAEGLVRGHSYSVTGAKSVNIPGYGYIVLVRVRNPWGRGEWNGPWSDGSPEWRSISETVKQELGLVYEDDGEFWMSYSDFVRHFEWVDMCHLSPNVLSDDSNDGWVSNWQLNAVAGSWVRGVTAGGARGMHRNPQKRLILNDSDDDNNDGLCSVLIALTQKPTGRNFDYNEIGFKVYSLDDAYYYQTPLDPQFFQNNHSVAQVPVKGVREVAERFRFLPGVYCVIPYTYEAGKEGEFLMRIYTEKGSAIDTIDYRIGLSPMKTLATESSPMKTEIEDYEKEDDEVTKQLYDGIVGKSGTGKKNEFTWIELKKVLDYVAKNDFPSSTEKGGEHFLVDVINFVCRKIFGSITVSNAFRTVGPGGFSKDACRSMVAMLDVDHSGKLSTIEFHTLWTQIKKWKSIYESHSKSSKGYLNSSRLKEAAEEAGFQLNNRILGNMVHRYANEDGKIPFDEFLHCVILLKNMSEFFNSKDKDGSHKAEFTLEEFIDKVVYS